MALITLADTTLEFTEDFLTPEQTRWLRRYLDTKVEWEQPQSKWGLTPRLIAFFADEGKRYAYSGITHVGAGWQEPLRRIRKMVVDHTGHNFNSLLLNYYRGGDDSIGWHSDSEKELADDPVVASLSIGATAKFRLQHKREKLTYELPLPDGSLLLMGPGCQTNWLHSVPKEKGRLARINLTFRNIVR